MKDNQYKHCVSDLLTVNETSVEPPQDDSNSLNSPRNLALEATFINHNFSQQVLKTVSFKVLVLSLLLKVAFPYMCVICWLGL